MGFVVNHVNNELTPLNAAIENLWTFSCTFIGRCTMTFPNQWVINIVHEDWANKRRPMTTDSMRYPDRKEETTIIIGFLQLWFFSKLQEPRTSPSMDRRDRTAVGSVISRPGKNLFISISCPNEEITQNKLVFLKLLLSKEKNEAVWLVSFETFGLKWVHFSHHHHHHQ